MCVQYRSILSSNMFNLRLVESTGAEPTAMEGQVYFIKDKVMPVKTVKE